MIATLNNVTKFYENTEGVSDLFASIPKGQIIGLLGANGSGKTTTLKLLAGLLRPTAGSVSVLGQSPENSRAEIALLSDLDSVLPWMDHRNVKFLNTGLFDNFNPAKYDELVDKMDIPKDKMYKHMSRGQKARIKLASVLARRCSLILLDEPLSGIDLISREKMLEMISSNWEKEKSSIILSTHEILEAKKLFNRVMILKEGKLIKDHLCNETVEAEETDVLQLYRDVLKSNTSP